MKIGALNRALLIALTLIVLAFCVLCIAYVAGAVSQSVAIQMVTSLQGGMLVSVIVAVIAFLVIIAALKLLFLGVGRQAPTTTVIRVTEFGQVNITLEALNHLVLKSAFGVEGIRDVKSVLHPMPGNAIRIQLRVATAVDAVIPEVTEALQRQVKEFVESHAGVPVPQLHVLVDNTMSQTGLARVQ